jgi:hypothetical protein
MADIRNCEQCGTSFAPRREHARFCSARCRVAWNRQYASGPPGQMAALDWAVAAMRETADRLFQASGLDRANGYALISEAVWQITIVDATLVRYRPDIYNSCLARQAAVQRRLTENTFAGLRFVRNRMGYDAGHTDFIRPLDNHPGDAAGRIEQWTWKSVPEPTLDALTSRSQAWELTRHRAYQTRLAGHPVGEAFSQATEFLSLAAESGSLSHTGDSRS